MKRAWITIIKLAVTAGAIAFLLNSGRLDFSEFQLRQDSVRSFGIAALLFVLGMTLAFVRHSVHLKAAGLTIPRGSVIRAGFVSWFLNASLLGGFGMVSGDAVRIAWLLKHTENKSALIGVTLFDRVVGLFALLTLATVAFAVTGGEVKDHGGQMGILAFGLYGFAAAFGLAVTFYFFWRRQGFWFLSKFLGAAAIVLGGIAFLSKSSSMWWILLVLATGWLGAVALRGLQPVTLWLNKSKSASAIQKRLSEFGDAMVRLRKRPLALLNGFALALCTHGLSILTLFFVSRAIVLPVLPGLKQLFFAVPAASAVGFLPLPANGLGVGEAAFDSILRLFRDPSGTIVAGGALLFLAYRGLTIVTGLSGLPFFLAGKQKDNVAKS